MNSIVSTTQVDLIRQDLRKNGITAPGLESDVLDHMICGTEKYMSEGYAFHKAYQKAWYDLNEKQALALIQQETSQAISEGKSVLKRVLGYFLILSAFIGIFMTFTLKASPALIMSCISVMIFFIYHSVFSWRRQKSNKHNRALFIGLTLLPIVGAVIFLIREFQFYIYGTSGWVLVIIFIAVPIYYLFVRKVLTEDSTLRQFLIQTFQFLSVASLCWIPLASGLQLFRPDVAVLFFLDDLLIISASSLLLALGLQKLSSTWRLLRSIF
ncbi:MAG: hypothetical protein AAF944_17625 [Bacteroidota bacterium]